MPLLRFPRWSWGYRRNSKGLDFMTIEECLQNLVKTVANNGNLLLNIGPTANGTIPQVFQDRLREVG